MSVGSSAMGPTSASPGAVDIRRGAAAKVGREERDAAGAKAAASPDVMPARRKIADFTIVTWVKLFKWTLGLIQVSLASALQLDLSPTLCGDGGGDGDGDGDC
mmetsp:Transcript_33808/g.100853  ORF Transcript_33808/g.100853 Transcript_33808/m.100853 type:complete len:103 (+) Transcript_33808:756-1064(+)